MSNHPEKSAEEQINSAKVSEFAFSVERNVMESSNKNSTLKTTISEDDFNFQEAYPTNQELGEIEVTSMSPTMRGIISPRLFAKRYTKLEVVNARQIELLLRWQYLFVAIGVLYTVVVIIILNTVYMKVAEMPKDQGWTFNLRGYAAPLGLLWFNYIMRFILFAAAFALMIVFSTRILSMQSMNITHEQVWTMILLASITIYMVPIHDVIAIHDYLVGANSKFWGKTKWFAVLDPIANVMFTSGFTCSTIFYVWASTHSYRFLESRIGFRFYFPKIVTLAVYVVGKVVILYTANPSVWSAELPFANLTGMLSIYYTANRVDVVGMWSAICITTMDLFFLLSIVYERRKTKLLLKKADYVKYRSKQIGFRFFMYHNLTFYLMYIALYITLQLALPNAGVVYQFLIRSPRISNFRTQPMNVGLQLMLLAYAWTEAYVNLPADALGFRGWFQAQSPRGFGADDSELEPITYRKREPPSLHGVVSDVNINCFIMQTHVTMFNFSWIVYYWDTKKVENFKIAQDVFKFTIADYIKDKETDTHALIVDGADRIVVSFKGTTSMKNLKTDIKMFHSSVRALLPTPLPETQEQELPPNAEEVINSRLWRRAQIHQGFSTAYRAIAPRLLTVLQNLVKAKRRPVFITGHSLGGALATVCSLDLFVTLGLTRREIFVSTFGAPRVGNRPFRQLYDSVVPIHWRIVVGPDVVAKLPKMGYTHCGKKVLITVDGDLFMDPNSLELNLWSGDTASILYHRKASYLLAMRAWCEKHHGSEYVPEFWAFPVSQDDTKRFQHVMCRHQNNTLGVFSSDDALNKRAKLLMFDAMIDKLPNSPRGQNKDTIMKWAKLTKLLLLQTIDKNSQSENPSKY